MLHLHPDLVDMTKAENFVPLSVAMERDYTILAPEGAVGFGWQTQDLQPAGACGNAAAADAARGGEVVDRAAKALVKLLEEIDRFSLSQLADHTAYDA